jgi:hypothetical protein
MTAPRAPRRAEDYRLIWAFALYINTPRRGR